MMDILCKVASTNKISYIASNIKSTEIKQVGYNIVSMFSTIIFSLLCIIIFTIIIAIIICKIKKISIKKYLNKFMTCGLISVFIFVVSKVLLTVDFGVRDFMTEEDRITNYLLEEMIGYLIIIAAIIINIIIFIILIRSIIKIIKNHKEKEEP